MGRPLFDYKILYKALSTSFTKFLTNPRITIGLLLLVTTFPLAAQISPSREYQLKAAFLFNFTQFVEWPPGAFPPGQAWRIGVLGDNPFKSYLDEIVSGEKVNEHQVIIHYYKTMDEVKDCHILFVNLKDEKMQQDVLGELKGRNILTVSDDLSFLENGGMIRLFVRNNKMKIQVNLEASKAADLVISSKLLRLAEIFTPEENN